MINSFDSPQMRSLVGKQSYHSIKNAKSVNLLYKKMHVLIEVLRIHPSA